jgi:hypothetical protein
MAAQARREARTQKLQTVHPRAYLGVLPDLALCAVSRARCPLGHQRHHLLSSSCCVFLACWQQGDMHVEALPLGSVGLFLSQVIFLLLLKRFPQSPGGSRKSESRFTMPKQVSRECECRARRDRAARTIDIIRAGWQQRDNKAQTRPIQVAILAAPHVLQMKPKAHTSSAHIVSNGVRARLAMPHAVNTHAPPQ